MLCGQSSENNLLGLQFRMFSGKLLPIEVKLGHSEELPTLSNPQSHGWSEMNRQSHGTEMSSTRKWIKGVSCQWVFYNCDPHTTVTWGT